MAVAIGGITAASRHKRSGSQNAWNLSDSDLNRISGSGSSGSGKHEILDDLRHPV